MSTNIVVLQTTWNRPRLLRQSLPQVEAEANAIGAQYVIADDQSEVEETIVILEEAKSRGIDVIQRDYIRDPSEPAHPLIGLNNAFAFGYVLEKYDPKLIIKCDDDIVLMPGAFRTMLDARNKAIADGHDVLLMSGIQTANEPCYEEYDGYNRTYGACNAAVIYDAADFERFLTETHLGNIVMEGFDCHFVRLMQRKWRAGSECFTTRPSVAYHTGVTGAHVMSDDINVNYGGSLEGVVLR